MATRDRTDAFRQARNRYEGNTNLRQSNGNGYDMGPPHLIEQGEDDVALTVAPGWMTNVGDIEIDIEKITEKIKDLSQLHTKHLTPGFDSRTDEAQEIDIVTEEISRMFHKTQTKIKKIGADTKLHPEEHKIKKNIQSKLALKLQDISQEFRSQQKRYLQQLRARDSGLGGDEFGLEPADGIWEELDTGFTANQMARLKYGEQGAQEWEDEMKNILKSVQDLNTIFKELSVMVVEQGTILDRIDYNLEQTEIHLEESIVQLTEAHKALKVTGTLKCMALLCFLIIAAFIILLIRLQFR